MAEPTERGPELISLRELARRLVAEQVVAQISHQRVTQLARDDPDFPPVVKVGRANAVDWQAAKPYFRERKSRQGERTDLKPKE
ncbi:hypothetical protein ACEZCY_14610 [Streptacidiphilus sp. N1-12]|uniref:Uncharacterized protein n=2 Tax=Streptacidiphilus alkalitolerans TaxID=3342712 RepID=A0ABV6VA45_9ACTN